MKLHRVLLMAVSLVATAMGQSSAPAQPDTLQALLAEVRQLRQTLVVIQRLAMQQQHVDSLSWQLDQVREQIARSAQESNALVAAVTANEARLAEERQKGAVRHDIEDEIKKARVVMEEQAVSDKRQRVRESQLAGQLQVEQEKLRELNDRLNVLDRATYR